MLLAVLGVHALGSQYWKKENYWIQMAEPVVQKRVGLATMGLRMGAVDSPVAAQGKQRLLQMA